MVTILEKLKKIRIEFEPIDIALKSNELGKIIAQIDNLILDIKTGQRKLK